MSKMSELSMLLENLINCGEQLTKTASALKQFYSSEDSPAVTHDEKKPEPVEEKNASVNEAGKAESKPLSSEKTLSKEDVRAILAAKATESYGAYRTQIKDLVKKYGNGGSLTDVDPKDYAALTAEAEAIGNAG